MSARIVLDLMLDVVLVVVLPLMFVLEFSGVCSIVVPILVLQCAGIVLDFVRVSFPLLVSHGKPVPRHTQKVLTAP